MTDDFEFQAPVYYDFRNGDDHNVTGDEFFNYYKDDDELENSTSSEDDDTINNSNQTRLRRSLSTNDINVLQHVNKVTEYLNDLNLTGTSSNHQFQRTTSSENIQPSKYVSFAEQTRMFHTKTPERFKSKPQGFISIPQQPGQIHLQHATIPQSPFLATKMRSRPGTNILTAEERELIEMENAKKNKFKAQVLNKKIFEAKNLKVVADKKPTQIEAFKLTEIKTKIVPTLEEFQFHANPVHKKMFETVIGVPQKQAIAKTVPKTPSFMKESRLRSKHLTINSNNGQLEYQQDAHHGIKMHKSPRPTKIKPFNVIKRSEQTQRRKEERIKQIIEEEKKMREFHAKPVPKFIKPKSSNCTVISTTSCSSNEENQTVSQNFFKARPASVLNKKPFVPIKKQRPLIEIQEFQLTLDQRIKEREEFEKKIKKAEETKKSILQKLEEEKRQQEEEKLNIIRQQAVVKAHPIKRFKEFILKPSDKELTSPHTPKFSSRIKK